MNNIRKVYVFAPAASGKSTFNNNYTEYNGFRIVDFASQLPKITLFPKLLFYFSRVIPPLRNIARRISAVPRANDYFDEIFKYLREQNQNIVVFGRKPPDDITPYSDIEFALVLIPEDQHERNCNSRRKQMRNPLPFFHHWTTNFENLKPIRENLQKYADQREIPIYPSFDLCIQTVTASQPQRRQ